MTEIEFDNILNKPESSILDFKRQGYNFTNDSNQEQTAKFVKDIISFANTIRTETAYIIIGVGENNDKTKALIGIENKLDDAMLQDKIKNKAFPRPQFSYYNFDYENLTFGIIEIPVQKYPLPISPTIILKGLETGKIYFRKGSTNTEALGIETININDWLKSLPDNTNSNNSGEEIADLIKRTTNQNENLSSILADVLKVAKKYNFDFLTQFASLELQGIKQADFNKSPEDFRYRNQTVYGSVKFLQTVVNANDSKTLKEHLIKDKDFHRYNNPFADPITNIENAIKTYKNDPKQLVTIASTTTNILFPEEKELPVNVYLYAFQDTFENLYNSIRQKLIDKLISTI